MLVRHTGSNTGLAWDGTKWVCIYPGIFAHVDPGGLEARKAVVIIDGEPVLCDPLIHDRVDGVIRAIFDGVVLRVANGEVVGYPEGGFTPGDKLYVTTVSGLTHEPNIADNILLVGHALTSSSVLVAISEMSGSATLERLTVDALTVHELEAGVLDGVADDNAEHTIHGTTVFSGGPDMVLLRVTEHAKIEGLLSAGRLEVGLTVRPDPSPYDDPYPGNPYDDPYGGPYPSPYPDFYSDIYGDQYQSPPELTGLTVDEAGNLRTSGFVVIKHAPGGLILRAPNGLYYQFDVAAGGALSSTGRLVGTTPP